MCNRNRIFGGITFPNFVGNACCNKCCEAGVVAQRVDSVAEAPACCCCCCGCCGCSCGGNVAGTSNCSCGNVAGVSNRRPCPRRAVGGASACFGGDPIWGDIGGIGNCRPPFFSDDRCRYPLNPVILEK